MARDNRTDKQMTAAREIMDRHRESLSALAGKEKPSEELQRRLEVARERMQKYHTVYRALSE
jgi:hypothetical protein